MKIQGCSQHADVQYILAFPTFVITATVDDEITFTSALPNFVDTPDFDEMKAVAVDCPNLNKTLHVNNLKKNYVVEVKSTFTTKPPNENVVTENGVMMLS